MQGLLNAENCSWHERAAENLPSLVQGKPSARFCQQRSPAHLLAAGATTGGLGPVAYLPGGPHHIAAAGARGMVREHRRKELTISKATH